jgi:selenocysteine lyase/cysteine desulfurase
MRVAETVLEGLRGLGVTVTSDPRSRHQSSIVSFTTGNVEHDAAIVTAGKAASVSLGRRGMGVRVAAHYWNSVEDAHRALDVVRAALRPR